MASLWTPCLSSVNNLYDSSSAVSTRFVLIPDEINNLNRLKGLTSAKTCL
jgi:hypothetical protein